MFVINLAKASWVIFRKYLLELDEFALWDSILMYLLKHLILLLGPVILFQLENLKFNETNKALIMNTIIQAEVDELCEIFSRKKSK